MKKRWTILVAILLILLLGIGLVYAAKGGSKGSDSKSSKSSVLKKESNYVFVDQNQERVQVTLRTETKTRDGQTYQKIKVRGVEAISELPLQKEQDGDKLNKLKTRLSNGNQQEIKIMPNKASDTAIEKLKTNKGIMIQLKETGVGNNLSVVYDFEGNRTTKLIGLFKVRALLTARVDAVTGDLMEFETPWWYFLVGKEILVPKCDPENLELCIAQDECETATGYWYNEVCNSEPQLVCDMEHLGLCLNQLECETATGYWYNEVCNAEPLPEPPTNQTNSSIV